MSERDARRAVGATADGVERGLPPWKVVRIIARLNVGGPGKHVLILADRLRPLGFETLLVFGTVGPGEASLEDQVTARGIRALKLPELGRSIHLWADLRVAWSLWGVLKREQPDVIHTHTSKAGVLGRLVGAAYNLSLPRDRRALLVHTFHGHVFSGYFGPLASRVVRRTERVLARLTDVIVAISPAQREDLVSRYRVAPAAKLEVVPLGLEAEPLLRLERPGPGSPASAEHPVTFGFLGRFVPIKDLATLLEAFAVARERTPDIRLKLFGGGELQAALEAHVERLDLAGRVEFAGWQRALQEVYADLDAVVLTSRNEGTPVAIIEAQLAGLPVVAADVGGVRDAMRPNETGLLVPAGDVHAVADALSRLAESADLRFRLGAEGRAWARERYAAARLTRDIERLYREGIARKRQGR